MRWIIAEKYKPINIQDEKRLQILKVNEVHVIHFVLYGRTNGISYITRWEICLLCNKYHYINAYN